MDPNQEETNTPPVEQGTPNTPDAAEAPATPTEPTVPGEDHASKNLIIIAVLAVIVIVLALLYVWGSMGSTTQTPETNEPAPAELTGEQPAPAVDPSIEALQQVSASDDVATIEEDLDTTDIEALDAELDQMMVEIDAELEAEVQ
jgi:flagellar basal body-associated protein FliL